MLPKPTLLLLACVLAGCDSLSAHSFAGTVLQMALEGAAPTAPAEHLELWARDGHDDVIRVDALFDPTDHRVTMGMQIRGAVTLDDPCMIVSDPAAPTYGELLVMPAAYPDAVTINGVTQSPAQQAQQVRNRIAQVTTGATCLPDLFDPGRKFCGRQATALLAVLPADGAPPTPLPPDATAAERAAVCEAYWSGSPLAYTPNPAQLTAPLHGVVYGFVGYVTTTPPAGYDGLRLDSPTNLAGIQELWLTREQVAVADVDPSNRGPVLLQGFPTPGGRDVVHFDLRSLSGEPISGTAALYITLDENTVEL